MSDSVRIVEVGPRDGLQNEARHVPTSDKIAFITALIDSGLAPVPGLTSGNVVNGPDLSFDSQEPNLRDNDGDGVITREEWGGATAVFDALDLDGDGRITADEVAAGLGAAFRLSERILV